MIKLSSNPTCVLSDADVITNEQAERIAKVLTKHLPGAGDVTEAGKILGVDVNGDVALVEDKTGSTYTAGEGLTLENGEFSVDNPMPGASGASQGDVLTVGANGPEWAAPSGGGSSNVEIIPLPSNSPADLDLFAIMVHDAYAAGKVVVAKLVNADNIYTMYLPMIKAYEGETKQYYFGGQAMYYDEDGTTFRPEEYFMYVYNYGDPHCEAVFRKARPTELAWSPFPA